MTERYPLQVYMSMCCISCGYNYNKYMDWGDAMFAAMNDGRDRYMGTHEPCPACTSGEMVSYTDQFDLLDQMQDALADLQPPAEGGAK